MMPKDLGKLYPNTLINNDFFKKFLQMEASLQPCLPLVDAACQWHMASLFMYQIHLMKTNYIPLSCSQ